MENERSAFVNIGGEQYELILTTKATKAIASRYGGLENLGERLMKAENFEMALDGNRLASYAYGKSVHPDLQPQA